MDRALPEFNRVVCQRQRQVDRAHHQVKLRTIRPAINMAPPASTHHPINKLKKQMMIEGKFPVASLCLSRPMHRDREIKRPLTREDEQHFVVAIFAEVTALHLSPATSAPIYGLGPSPLPPLARAQRTPNLYGQPGLFKAAAGAEAGSGLQQDGQRAARANPTDQAALRAQALARGKRWPQAETPVSGQRLAVNRPKQNAFRFVPKVHGRVGPGPR